MRLDKIRALPGPNIYSHGPVLVARIYLEELTDKESREIAGCNERLLACLPGLMEHRCSRERRGGFVERLHEGTYFAHIIEHVALELSEHAGIPASFGKARWEADPGCYNIIIEYSAEYGARYLLQLAVDLVAALVKDEPFPLQERLAECRRIIAETELGPSTRAIVDAAIARGIPYFRIGDASLVQLGYGRNRRQIQAAICDRTRAVAVEVAGDKELTKTLLDQVSIPVPRGITTKTWAEAVDALERIGPPVVVKPLDGRQGKGVSLNLTTPEEVAHAFHIAAEYSDHVLVEELYTGRNYRVLVVGNRVVAASERFPCHVIGDGRHTIAELIEIANRDPRRGEGHEKPLTKIVLDDVIAAHLEKVGLTLDHIPHDGEVTILREGINLSTGGTASDVTDIIHPSVARMCERAARVIGMDVCGVDLVLKDISAPLERGSGGIIELNASPGLRMHLYPSEGRARDVGAAIVDLMYPPGTTARIPLIAVTGTNGKTTVTRMISHVIAETCEVTVGTTTTDGIYINGERIVEGDTTGPHSARTVLADPCVDVAVLETARGGITRRGLGYDWSDIGVMTNIGPDHIGQDGIRSVEDLVFIKSLVAERVREGGTLILNADDEHLSRLAEEPRVTRTPKQVVYFSLHENNLVVRAHLEGGGTAYYLKDGWLVEARGRAEESVVEAGAIPATLGGAAEFQVANALACLAACRAYGLTNEQVASALKSFRNDAADNPGRTNLYRTATGGYVLLDYGHNPDAFKAICRMASLWQGHRVTGIIGVPGDRDDTVIEEAARVAARGFHRLVIKEDEDPRGRRPGEVAELLCRTVQREVAGRECRTVLDETEALEQELEKVGEGDVLVMFYDRLAPVLEILERHGARPASTVQLAAARFSFATA
jgi:cyanophycin synthetase